MEAEKIRTDAELQKEQMRIEEEKTKRDEAAAAEKLKLELETERIKLELAKQNNTPENEKTTDISNCLPELPVFDDHKDDIDAYLARFERIATIYKCDKERWATALSTLLLGKALETYSRLPITDAIDYDKVKAALLKHYNMTEEGMRKKFRESRPEKRENPTQFITRIATYLDRGVDMANATDYESLRQLIIREQFLNICPQNLAIHLKERQYTEMEDMCTQAERFLEAHSQFLRGNNEDKENQDERDKGSRMQQVRQKECSNCKKIGHTVEKCRNKGGGNEQQCLNCSWYGHLADECRNTSEFGGLIQTTQWTKKRIHHRQSFNIKPTKDCNTHEFSSIEKNFKVVQGMVNNHVVDTLRDSGCTTVCVNKKFILPGQLTGKYKYCKLMDGTTRRFETAIVALDTPYLKRDKIAVLCMENPEVDLVIGEVPGARCKCSPVAYWSHNFKAIR